MKVKVDRDEYYPFHFFVEGNHYMTELDLPVNKINEINRALDEFAAVQSYLNEKVNEAFAKRQESKK